ncbi:MAG: hypothetical protein ACD_63C00058G0001 [uncultured bacterium]|nr:MAG: hypothetical protein ACD_63C00058G0001 [uncultured bacterium]
MFDKDFLKKQKGRLLEEKRFLERRLEEIGGKKDKHVKNVEDFDVSPPGLSKENEPIEDDLEAQEVETYSNSLAVEDVLEKKLDDVNVALKRMEDSKYGECDNCKGGRIPKERLEALPAARVCLDCEGHQKGKASEK